MFSCSLNAGMTTSTVAVRQFFTGVGGVVSRPRSNPRMLISVFGPSAK